MQKLDFSEAVSQIVAQDPRFDEEAYGFVRDALEFTLKRIISAPGGGERHVSGEELLAGFREYTLAQYGPMALTVLDHWGVRATDDVGAIVFNLISANVFGKTDRDSPDDFHNRFDFREAFVKPFLPDGRRGGAAPPCPGSPVRPEAAPAGGGGGPSSRPPQTPA